MGMRRLAADTFAMTAFSTTLGFGVEVLVAGLSLERSAHVRLAAIPINLIVGRPYGVYRDWLFKLSRSGGAAGCPSILIDSFANASFQVPLYSSLLLINGATIGQTFAAVGTVAVISTVSGRPCGLFMTLCRRVFRVDAEVGKVKREDRVA